MTNCPQLDTCSHVARIMDQDILEAQKAEGIREMCAKCTERPADNPEMPQSKPSREWLVQSLIAYSNVVCPLRGEDMAEFKGMADHILGNWLMVEQSVTLELVEACKTGLEEMIRWRDSGECDCPGEGHICGRPRLERNIETVEVAVAKVREVMQP